MIFHKRLVELRKSRGIVQVDLANALNTDNSRIAMFERGKDLPSLESLIAIADFFDVSIDYLVGRTDLKHTHKVIGTAEESIDAMKTELANDLVDGLMQVAQGIKWKYVSK